MPARTEKASNKDFATLGLPPTATAAQVKRAYRDLVRLWHPDRLQQRSSEARTSAEERLKAVTAAYRRICSTWRFTNPASQPGPWHPPGGSPRWRRLALREWSAPLRGAFAHHAASVKGSLNAWIVHPQTAKVLTLAAVLMIAVPLIWDPGSRSSKAPTVPPATVGTAPRSGGQAVAPAFPSVHSPRPAPRHNPAAQPAAQRAAHSDPAVPRSTSPASFSLGSPQAEVLRIQGPPTKTRGSTWVYGTSEVHFRDGAVVAYNNFDSTLQVQLLPRQAPPTESLLPGYVTLGSSQDEVLWVHGTPTRIERNRWFYGFSSIHFKHERVVGFDNFFGNLNVRILPSRLAVDPGVPRLFTIGSSRDDVLAVQGTPTSIQGNLWFYQLSNILFRNGQVAHVVNAGGNLHFAPPQGS